MSENKTKWGVLGRPVDGVGPAVRVSRLKLIWWAVRDDKPIATKLKLIKVIMSYKMVGELK